MQQAVKEWKAVMAREDPTTRWTVKSTDSGFTGTQFRRHGMGRAYRLIEYSVARSVAGPAAKIQVRVWQATVSPLVPVSMTDEERRTHCG
ncbi:hypothetical protein AXK60_18650 [Tsukamurella pseudospumae]|uniref:Uncharacterized protein n=1 Tax=Tsukamurella pseudospumae TaxID=239498 RepID=A0A138A076_9ACTN|nr:hypothetical protein AXK61_10715 [Tsukamurella pseudospumae]KXP03802.1 hypothetical protein AXK60_18650 [Tsukamurella pseudospumae]